MGGLFRPKEYFRPSSLQKAVSLLAEHGPTARPLAGGTDLIVERNPKIEYLVDITRLPLSYIKEEKDTIRMGALTTFRQIEASSTLKKKPYSVLVEAVQMAGHPAQRNMATVGGNICSAVPSAEMPPPLIALGTKVKIVGTEGERTLPLEEVFTGPKKTGLKSDELLTEFQVAKQPPKTAASFEKISRTHVDLALVNVATRVTLDAHMKCKDVRIVFGAVAPTPFRAKESEAFLIGKKLDEELIEQVCIAACEATRPISDIRASAEYRREMSKVLARRALRRCLEDLKGAA
jgi:carbon-monoxide dehydrogenase medium subunit